MTNFINTTQANSLYPVANAITSSGPFVDAFMTRDPTQYDVNYPIQKKWLNTTAGTFWELEGFTSTPTALLADWIKIGSTSLVESLQGNTGAPVPPNGASVITTIGDGVGITVAGNPGANTLTWSLVGGGVAAQKFGVDTFTGPGTNPVVPSAAGLVTITGGQVAAGTTTNVIRTDSLAANTYTIQVQRSQAVAVSTVGDNGVSHFNSTDFIVDANGFVSLVPIFNYVQINHASSPYTVTATDFYISCDPTAGTISILLPNAPTLYRRFTIKDRTGHASVNNISVTTVDGIDGETTYTIAGNFGAINFLWNGTTYEVF